MKKYLYALFFLFCVSDLQAQMSSDAYILEEKWQSFSTTYPSLSKFTPEEIAVLANQWAAMVSQTLSISSEGIRSVDSTVIKKLLTRLQEDDPKIFMRHGEQQKSERTKLLPLAEQKIEMMRLPDNMENALTKASLAEWMAGMIVWEYLKQKTGRRFIVESSGNCRAEQPASALAYALNIETRTNENLNCVNYLSSDEMSNEEILKRLPDGTLPWEKQKVDAVISSGTYENITLQMKKLINVSKGVNVVFIAITHTQQTNAIASLLDLPVIRLGNFGFILVTEDHSEIFAEGFYKK